MNNWFFPGEERLRLPGTLQRYVTREYLFSFLVAFLFFLAIFFVNQILVIARDRLAEQVSVIDTLRLILYAMPAIIALSVPYASFIGIILAVGKLSEGREIQAARASGISFTNLLYPILLSALLLSGLSFITNDYFLPLGTMRYSQLYQELLYSNSRLIIEPYAIRNYENATIVTGDVIDDVIQGIIIIDRAEDGSERTISASRASLIQNDTGRGIITLNLRDVEIISSSERRIHESRADNMDYNILLENIVFNINNPSVREMSARDVYSLVQQRQEQFELRKQDERLEYHERFRNFSATAFSIAETRDPQLKIKFQRAYDRLSNDPDTHMFDRTLRLYRIEFWKKFSIPLASLTFIFIGFPLGLMSLKHGRTLGIILGLILASAYWGMLVAIEALGLRLTSIPPGLITFSPNILMLAAGSAFLYGYLRR